MQLRAGTDRRDGLFARCDSSKSHDFQRVQMQMQWQSVDSGKQSRLVTSWLPVLGWHPTFHSSTTSVSDCSPGSQAVGDRLVVCCLVELLVRRGTTSA
jgi:hypothetical protein